MHLYEAVLQALEEAAPKALTVTELHRERLRVAGRPYTSSGTGGTVACALSLSGHNEHTPQYLENPPVEFLPGPPKSFRKRV